MNTSFARFNDSRKINATLLVLKRCIFDSYKISNQLPRTISEVRDNLKQLVGFSAVYSNTEADKSVLHSYKIKSQNELQKSRMHQSFAEAIIPIGSQPKIRERYVNSYHKVRFGRLLEDLDTMAVHVSYLHNQSQCLKLDGRTIAPIVIVTALVDRIEMKQRTIEIEKDLKITGYTSWVGKTSSETKMKLEQEISPNNWVQILEAKFLVCARDIFNKGSAIMNPLDIVTTEERNIYDTGERNKQSRHKESQESLFNVPPNQNDSTIIHEIFKETIDLKSGSLQHRIKPTDSLWMEETKIKNVIICHPEQRNIYNKIFGGYLMRKGFELAWINASLFSQGKAEISFVDDITFRKPVTIGSLLFLSSQVVYTEQNSLMVKVHAEVVDPLTGSRDTTNELYFKFIVPNKVTIPRVIPKTYSEAMIYIDGKRHW